MSQVKLVNQQLQKVREDLGAIEKNRKTSGGSGWHFRGVEDVLNQIGPLFQKYEVLTGQAVHVIDSEFCEIESYGKKYLGSRAVVKVTVFFEAMDGSNYSADAAASSIDHKSDKAVGQAESMAYKAAILKGLCIPCDPKSLEDGDRDSTAVVVDEPKPEKKAKPSGKKQAREVVKEEPGEEVKTDATPKDAAIALVEKKVSGLGIGHKAVEAACKAASGQKHDKLQDLTLEQLKKVEEGLTKLEEKRAKAA